MRIEDIWAYYINPDSFSHRKAPMEKMLSEVPFKGTTRVAFNGKLPDRANTMTAAHISLLEQANNIPFIVLEDDARIMKPLPEEFDVPKEASLIYLGGSNYDCGMGKPNMYITDYNKDYYRVYYMLSFHAVLIPSASSVELLLGILRNALKNTKFNDLSIAMASKDNVFLVPKEGNYFYQEDYTRFVTKFEWKDQLKKMLK